MIDEPGFISTRTDAGAYADRALNSILQGAPLDERGQGYVREMLESAFEDGERQGEFRALWILVVAEKRATSPDASRCWRRICRDGRSLPIDTAKRPC